MFCGQCGTDNADANRFCLKCGRPLSMAAPPPPVSDAVHVQCVSGADAGKMYSISTAQSVLGRCAGLADPLVAERHVLLWSQQGTLHFQSTPEGSIEINGARVREGSLSPGQTFKLGSSAWQVVRPPASTSAPGTRHINAAAAAQGTIDNLKNRLHHLAGTESLEGFSLKEMFSEVFKRRTSQEIEDYFIVGTAATTPRIQDVPTGWPKPWFFFRVLVFVLALYFGLDFAAQMFNNAKMLPGMLIMGSLAVPFSTVILFFELNVPRNVPFHRVLMLVCFGGVISLIIALFGFSFSNLDWLGASSAGIIEEIGKLLTVALLMRKSREKYILNGLLYGAAVGAGFAFFESAGYAFEQLLNARSLGAATDNIQLRALLAPFGHVAWTAISAGALWRAKGEGPVTLNTLLAPTFLKAMVIPIVLHMIWNAPIDLLMLKYVGVGVVAWFVVFGLVQQGLKQVKREQVRATNAEIAMVEAAG
jgi:RsiW-degrading membrane proteinase PrsW (M82 family)